MDPVLRRFGQNREIAVEEYRRYVRAGVGVVYPPGLDSPAEPRVRGEKEFVDDAIHRLGEMDTRGRRIRKENAAAFDMAGLLAAVEEVFELPRDDFQGPSKAPRAVMAKEIVILIGHEAGVPITELAAAVGLDQSTVSRRCGNAKLALASDSKVRFAKEMVEKLLRAKRRE